MLSCCNDKKACQRYVSSYLYVSSYCCMCLHTTIYVSSYYYKRKYVRGARQENPFFTFFYFYGMSRHVSGARQENQ